MIAQKCGSREILKLAGYFRVIAIKNLVRDRIKHKHWYLTGDNFGKDQYLWWGKTKMIELNFLLQKIPYKKFPWLATPKRRNRKYIRFILELQK